MVRTVLEIVGIHRGRRLIYRGTLAVMRLGLPLRDDAYFVGILKKLKGYRITVFIHLDR